MKRLLSLLLAAVMALSLAACGGAPAGTTAPPETTAPETMPVYPVSGNPVTFFNLTLGEDFDNIRYLTAFPNEDGTTHIEYQGDYKKIGTLDASAMHAITAVLAESGLTELNGAEVWEEGDPNGSMYITFADESYLTCNYSGQVPQAYTDGYAKLDALFQKLTASIDEYVPQPTVMGEVEEPLLSELLAILADMPNSDSYTIMPVVQGEDLAFALGLSSGEGIAAAASCAPMMMTTAYSLAMVRLEEGADSDAVCADFAANVDWMKWVCVMPNNAMVAVKDDLVLCLVAEGQLYSLTAIGIENAGWTVVETMEKPN